MRSIFSGFKFMIIVTVISLTPEFANSQDTGQNAVLSEQDIALIKEVFHLQNQLGHEIWSGWTQSNMPFLYKTEQFDVLLYHPNPPADFKNLYSANLCDSIWVKINTDSTDFQAAYPIGGVKTAVMTAPKSNDLACLWVLKAVHELFHVYQNHVNPDRIVNPFVGQHAGKHELSYPFPYDGDAIASIFRIEAEHLFQLITKDELSEIELTKGRQIFRHIFNVQQAIFRDSLDVKYKQWMEWNEGVARYTEIQLAILAADTNTYSPTKVFVELFPEANYTDTWKSKYGSNPTINPIRFVGEGVKGRVMFYFLGMGKAFLLDKIFPDWKQHYFEQTLDEMVILH